MAVAGNADVGTGSQGMSASYRIYFHSEYMEVIMKSKYKLALWLVLCILLPSLGLSHPGRTDSNGGHTNRKTGDYHYHNGGSGAPPPKAEQSEASTDTKSQEVYVTRTGKKYHRDGCSHLKSRIPISLADAKKSYTPCKVCSPPS